MSDGALRRLGRGLGALAVLVLLLVGIPIALAVLVGWPLPHGLPSWNEFRSALTTSGPGDEVIVKGLAVVCWLAWATLAASVVLEVAGVVRGRGSRRVPFAGPVQALAANLVAAVVLTLPSVGVRTTPPATQPLAARLRAPTMSPIVAAAPPVVHELDQPIALMSATSDSANEAAGAEETYTVARRDTLWRIAEVHLGDPFRWPELFALNQGRPQPDGRILTDPNLIRPGWVLTLPVVVATPTEAPPTQGVDGAPGLGAPSVAAPLPTSSGPPSSTAATPDSTVPRPTPNGDRPVEPATKPAEVRPMPDADSRKSHDPGGGIHLPAGSFVGLSLAAGLSASLAAARLHRRRRRLPEIPGDGISFEEPLGTEAVRRLRRADLTTRAHRAGNGRGGNHPADIRDESRQAAAVGTVSVGSRGNEHVELDVLTEGGVGLTGAGAPGVARSIVLDFVSNAAANTAEVVIAGSHLAGHLFPGVEPFAGVEVTDDVGAAITRLEVELVHRTRLIDDDEDTDFASYLEQNPAEPLPVVLLVADEVRGGLRLRLDAVASVGRRLGIGALVLSPPPGMATLAVMGDGSVDDESAPEALGHLRGACLFSIEPFEAREILQVVAAGKGRPDDLGATAETKSESFPVEATSDGGTVSVHLLGTYRIEVDGEEIRTGLRTKARELLAFLLLHPKGKSVEAAVDAIWPDTDAARGTEGFRTAVGNVRKILRTATGNAHAAVIERVGERYRVEASLFDCDLWRLEDALRDAGHADRAADLAAALGRATKECVGDLLNGSYYEWAETPREDIRRRSLDALAKVADIRADSNDMDAAIAALEDAIRLDPYAEELYRRMIACQISANRTDAAKRTLRQLEIRLGELDVDPDESTTRLLGQSLKTLS